MLMSRAGIEKGYFKWKLFRMHALVESYKYHVSSQLIGYNMSLIKTELDVSCAFLMSTKISQIFLCHFAIKVVVYPKLPKTEFLL